MKEKFLNSSISLIGKYQNINEGDRDKLLYGLEGLYLTITKTIAIFLCAFILGIIKEVLILLIFFNILRFTGFGFHAKKSLECFVVSILSFVLFPLLLLKLNVTNTFLLVAGIIGSIYIFLYAPADTVKRPLPNRKKRIIRKAVTTIESIIYTAIAIYINNYISILMICSILCECFMVSPITYKIFKQPYRNYLTYQA